MAVVVDFGHGTALAVLGAVCLLITSMASFSDDSFSLSR